MRGFILTLLTVFASSFSSAWAQENNQQIAFSDKIQTQQSRFVAGEELIYSVIIDKSILGDQFVVIGEQSYFIDFETFISVVDFPIQQTSSVSYEGWYISPSSKLSVDFSEPDSPQGYRVRSNGRTITIPSNHVKNVDGLIYVSVEAMEALFPMILEMDDTSLNMTIKPTIAFPIQKKLARQKKLINNSFSDSSIQYPQLSRDYALLSPQSLDVLINGIYSENNESFSDGYSIIGGREVAYLNSRFFLQGDSDDLVRAARLTLSRNFRDDYIANNLNIGRVEVGDINPVQFGTQGFRGDALGVIVTNQGNNRELNNNRTITLEGEVQNGWDVELYRNGILTDRQLGIEDGRYRFEDVTLFIGENTFDIVLYGPQGQEIRRTVNRFVDGNALGGTDLEYRTSISKLNSSLFGTRNEVAELKPFDVFDWSTQIRKGLTRSTSVNAGLRLQSSEVGVNEVTVGLNSLLTDRVRLSLDYFHADNDFKQLNADIRATFFGHDFNINASQIDRAGFKTNQAALQFRGSFQPFDYVAINYENGVAIAESGSNTQTIFTSGIGVPTPIGLFNHSVRFIEQESIDIESGLLRTTEEIEGSFNYRQRIGPVISRAGLSYNEDDVTNYNLDFSWMPMEYVSTRLVLSYAPEEEELFSRFDIGYENEVFNLSANITHSESAGYRLGLSTRMSLGGEPFNQGVFLTRRQLSNQGSLSVRVFHDANANGVYNPGERLLPNIKVEALQARSNAITDENGIALLHALPASRLTDITVDLEDAEDPFLRRLVEGVSLEPRQGFIDSLDFPLISIVELEGNINIVSADDTRADIPPLQIELVDASNNIIKATRAEFDGYFFMSEIRPGRYTLRVRETDFERFELKASSPINVNVYGSEEFITLPDIVINKHEFAIGYTANLGTFRNLGILKSFWQALVKKHPDVLAEAEVFFAKEGNRYQLNVGYDSTLSRAEALCNRLVAKKTKCATLSHREKI
ncbi:hypothetical protein PN836_000055 [Ningiella sp. W23]|uniref:hypothetical protein n=1 Tax=Ningiella sp. W23 TaxID=3023715 RepID=UPI003758255E